jgi:arginase family enzyme
LPRPVHLNFDDAWVTDSLSLDRVEACGWGPQLRFSAPPRLIEQFYSEHRETLPPFVVYGSGDFHHVTALLARRVEKPFVVVSFDNHPDWDVRPPRWCCGSWINRALELPHVDKVSVWGCGNFECWWPGQLFGNRRAERRSTLEVHPWADNRSEADRQRRGAILQSNWREHFTAFCEDLSGRNVYVTIDIDCLGPEEAVTNWENGRFSVADVEWALTELRSRAEVVAGDICGAFSPPVYARRKQRFAADIDHPKLKRPPLDEARRINSRTLARLLPVLTD